MAITQHNKPNILSRLSKASGHLDAVYRMVDDERYCIDVLHQLKAVQAALDKVGEEILKQHLETCVVEAIQNQDSQRVVNELMAVFKKANSLDITAEEAQRMVAESSASPKGCCG